MTTEISATYILICRDIVLAVIKYSTQAEFADFFDYPAAYDPYAESLIFMGKLSVILIKEGNTRKIPVTLNGYEHALLITAMTVFKDHVLQRIAPGETWASTSQVNLENMYEGYREFYPQLFVSLI